MGGDRSFSAAIEIIRSRIEGGKYLLFSEKSRGHPLNRYRDFVSRRRYSMFHLIGHNLFQKSLHLHQLTGAVIF